MFKPVFQVTPDIIVCAIIKLIRTAMDSEFTGYLVPTAWKVKCYTNT